MSFAGLNMRSVESKCNHEASNKRRYALVVLLIVVGGLYLPSLWGPFHFDDDTYVLRNRPIRDIAEWRSWPWEKYNYRVLYQFSLAANYHFGELSPWSYRAFNVLGHLLTVGGVFCLTSFLIRNTKYEEHFPFLSIAAAGLYAVHPLASEPPLYVMARNSGWSGMLMVWATVFALLGAKFLPGEKRRDNDFSNCFTAFLWCFAAVITWAASLLFKQTSAVWPLLLVAVYIFQKGMPKRSVTWLASGLALMLSVVGIFVGWRTGILAKNPLNFSYLATQLVIGPRVWSQIVLPFGLNIEHDFPIYGSFLHYDVIVALVFHLFLGAMGCYWLSRRKLAGLGIVWAYIVVLPTNSILFRPDYLSDRHLYLFAIGGIWLLTDGIHHIAQWAGCEVTSLRWKLPTFGVLGALFMVGTAYRIYVFGDRIRLLEDAYRKSPNHPRVCLNLGQEYEHDGQQEKALEMYHRCVGLWRQNYGKRFAYRDFWASMALNNFGAIVASRKNTEEEANRLGRRYFKRALQIDSRNPIALNNMAVLWLEKRKPLLLLEAAKRQIGDHMAGISPFLHRGCALAALGNDKRAIPDLRLALEDELCEDVIPGLRARALGALISIAKDGDNGPLAVKAATQLSELAQSGQISPGRVWRGRKRPEKSPIAD